MCRRSPWRARARVGTPPIMANTMRRASRDIDRQRHCLAGACLASALMRVRMRENPPRRTPLSPLLRPQQVESTCIHTYIVDTYRAMPLHCGKWRAGPGRRVCGVSSARWLSVSFSFWALCRLRRRGGRTDIRVSYRCKPRVRASIRSGHAAAPWFRDVRPESDSCCFCQGPIIRRSDSDGVRGRRVITVRKRRARLQNTAVTRSPPTSQANSRVETERPSLGFLRGIIFCVVECAESYHPVVAK